MDLNDLRKSIDEIDRELINLLEKRMNIAKEVGEYKKINDIPILNINRELDVLKSLKDRINCKEYNKQLIDVYISIMKGSRELQEFVILGKDEIKINKIQSSKISYGLLGQSLCHSISPEIHNKIFKDRGLNCLYDLFEIHKDNLELFKDVCESYGIKGFNVTMPYKIDIVDYLDEVHDIAKNIGSVNTVKIDNGVFKGYNTDYFGFERLLVENNIDIKNKRILILGNGGSCKTVTYYCKSNSVSKIYIASRSKHISTSDIEYLSYDDLDEIDVDVIVNTTPVGMFPNDDVSPIAREIVEKASYVVDIIYNPEETLLLKYAKESSNCLGYGNGKSMVLAQALKAEEIWGNI